MCKSVNDRTLIFVFIREKKKKKSPCIWKHFYDVHAFNLCIKINLNILKLKISGW